MSIGEHLQPGHGPIGLASSDSFAWARPLTGVFAVAISLAMSWPTGWAPVEQARTQASQPEHQEQEQDQVQATTADVLDRRKPEIVKLTALSETLSPPAAPAQVERKPAKKPPGLAKRHQLQRMPALAKAKGPPDPFPQSKAGTDPWSIEYDPIAHAKLTRRRSEVRDEYIAERKQVSALTGEDSGSAYLTSLAARQNAVPTNLAAHAHNRSQARGRHRLDHGAPAQQAAQRAQDEPSSPRKQRQVG